MKSETQPAWQKISGLNPATEQDLPLEQRDAGIRKLVAEVERLAQIEFDRGDKVPAGERTLFWDPLARICALLSISRTKLSNYSRELTGMRAHEITDRLKAKSLPDQLRAYLENLFTIHNPLLRSLFNSFAQDPATQREKFFQAVQRFVKSTRSGPARAHFAATLGYANPSRLTRACLLAHQKSLEHLESDLLDPIVQKFFDEWKPDASAREHSASEAREQVSPLTKGGLSERNCPSNFVAVLPDTHPQPESLPKESPPALTPAESEALINEVCAQVIRERKPRVA